MARQDFAAGPPQGFVTQKSASFSADERHPPHHVAHVVGHQQRAPAVQRHAHRPALRLAVRARGSRSGSRPAARRAGRRRRARTPPCSPLCGLRFQEPCSPMKAPLAKSAGMRVVGEHQAQRRDVRAQRVVRRDRLGHHVGTRRLDARVDVAGPSSSRASRRRRRPSPRSGSRAPGRCRARRARSPPSTAPWSAAPSPGRWGCAGRVANRRLLPLARSTSQMAARPSSDCHAVLADVAVGAHGRIELAAVGGWR